MAKATVVKIISVGEDGVGVRCGTEYFTIKSFDRYHKVLEIDASTIVALDEVVRVVIGCFEARSTFEDVRWIKLKFGKATIRLSVNEALGKPEYVLNKLKKALDDALKVEFYTPTELEEG